MELDTTVATPIPLAHMPDLAQSGGMGESFLGAGPTKTDGQPSDFGGGEFWDFGHDLGTQSNPMATEEFDELSKLERSKQWMRSLAIFLVVFFIGVSSYISYETTVNHHNPIRDLMMVLGVSPDTPETVTTLEHLPKPKRGAAAAAPTAPKAAPAAAGSQKKDAGKVVQGNPYWSLPNHLAVAPEATAKALTPEEEENFNAGLQHHFTYQHYKTIQELRALHAPGSDVVFWQGLSDKKLWNRLNSAMGLAEQGIEVPVKALDTALAQARSELIAGYFERFVKNPAPAPLYIMRQAVRLLDERGRLVILRAIVRSHDELRDLYLVAASMDPGKHVQKWATRALAEHPIEDRDKLEAMILGQADAAPLLPKAGAKAGRGKNGDGQVGAMTDEEVEEQLDQMEGGSGDVEFYDDKPAPAPVDDTPPPPSADSFEYKD